MKRLRRAAWARGLIAFLAVSILSGAFFCFKYKVDQEKKEALIWQQEYQARMEPTDENSINVVSEQTRYATSLIAGGERILDTDLFIKRYERGSNYLYDPYVRLDISDLGAEAEEDILYLLRFKMRACDRSAIVCTDFGEKHDFYVSTEWTEYYYPCTGKNINYVNWELTTDFQIVQLSDVEIYQYHKSQIDMQMMECGSYLASSEETTLDTDAGLHFGEECRDIQYYNGYLYAVGNESLFIGKENTGGSVEIHSILRGLGEVRRLEIYDDSMLAVASRHNGVYLIDVSDKYKPQIISRYYTLEIANDICFSSNYMFVAGRYFGVEIVDISNPRKPVFVTKISNSRECYRVAVKDDTLYVSCWARGFVELYDISVINAPRKVSEVSVDGRCGEAYIEDDYLYIVTGYSSMRQRDSVGEIGYGTGNGLTIYDVSDKNAPQWVSAVKTDGSMYHSGFDDWSVCVSDGIAYFTSSYDGLYIYDVSDVYAPKRIDKISVPLYKNKNKEYVDMTASDAYVFPYNCAERIDSPVTGVSLGDGTVYITCAYSDSYAIDFMDAKPLKLDREMQQIYTLQNEEARNRYKEVMYYLENENVYVIKKSDEGFYYAGVGTGIYILDSELAVVSFVPTESPVQDIVIQKDYLYTAETDGMGIYKMEPDSLRRISFYTAAVQTANVSSLAVTSDGNFAIMQAAFAEIETVDIRDKEMPLQVTQYIDASGNEVELKDVGGTGSLYYRNIVNGTVRNAIGIIGMQNSLWFQSVGEKLQIIRSYENGFYREEGGSAAIGEQDQILTICQNGYKIYDPLTVDENAMSELDTYKIQDAYISGKATVSDNILVVCNAYQGVVWVADIQNPENPRLMGTYITSGNPDLCFIEDDRILIPVRHDGLMCINRKN